MTAGAASSPLTLAVVVSTRNRAAHALECAQSILASSVPREVVFIDQSDTADTEQALAGITDPRLRCVRSATRGVTNGRNLGVTMTTGSIIAITDDDCRATAEWAPRILAAFDVNPAIAAVCGRVHVPEHIRHLGHTEGFEPDVREWRGRYPPLGKDWGIGANFSVRRSVFEQVGLFDPILGPGGALRAAGGEEYDFLFRVIRAGFTVINAREVVTDHYGIRKHGEESRALIVGYGVGTGAAIFKHVRLLDPQGILLYSRFVLSWTRLVLTKILTGTRPTGAGYLRAFLKGAAASFRFRIDPRTRLFLEP